MPKAAIEEAAPGGISISEFESLLTKEFKPKNVQANDTVKEAVKTLAAYALEDAITLSDDSVVFIENLIAEIDRKLSEQMSLIMHHPEFQQIEGSWRGLEYLIFNTEISTRLKIRVMNVKKAEVGKTLKNFKGTAFDQSPLFKKVYEEEFGTAGGEPYGCLIGDYYFDHSFQDVEIQRGMAKIAAAAHCPFIAGASPLLMNMDSWQELSNPRDLAKIFTTPEYAGWRSLRSMEDSRYLALAMPRFLARLPYGSKTNPVEEFSFEEDCDGTEHDKYTWCNSAYAMGACITRAFANTGWCARIRGPESGGMIQNLPTHTFPTDDGGVDMKCPTEVSITDRREHELANAGFMPLYHWKNTDYAVFLGAQSLQKPQLYDDPDATANANLSARLPYLFAACRFAHYLKCIVRDKIGSYKEKDDMQRYLQRWIMQYVTSNSNAAEEIKCRYPLNAAEVAVEDVPGNPGYYTAKFYLRPHFQLEGLTVSLRLVAKLPSQKK